MYPKTTMNIPLLIATLAIPGLALPQGATRYQCSNGDLKRRVEIQTEPGVSVPCEVHYYKDTEAPGDRQVLWSASSDAAYCEQKTAEFIGKLRAWGWSCEPGDTASDSSVPDEASESAMKPPAPGSGSEPGDALAPAEQAESKRDTAP